MADELPQERPRLDVNVAVGGVTVVDLAMHRHGTIGADGDAEEQLLEVGPVVFVIAKGDQGWSLGTGGLLALVLAGEGDAGGVVMGLLKVEVKLLDDTADKGSEQGGAVGVVQRVQGTTNPVVFEQGGLTWCQAKVLRDPA